MRKCLLLFILLFSCLNIYSQNLSYLFQNDLPKDIHKYFTDESVNDILIRDAELNPALIYWHINFLKELVENKNTNNDKNGMNYLKKLTNQNLHERNDFLEEIKLRTRKDVSDEYKRKINDILNDYILDYPQVADQKNNIPDYDTNKVYYIETKYLTGNRKFSYNKDENYQAQLKQLELTVDAELKQKLIEMKNQQGNITMDYLEYLIKNWWLVKTDPGISNELSSSIMEYIDQKYSIRKIGRIDITAGYAYAFHEEWFSYDFMSPINHSSNHISEMKNYSIYGKVSVPVFIVTPELILHAGIMAGINYTSADLSYIYSIRKRIYTYEG